MSKSGVEAYIYLDFYSDEIYTEDEINKITEVDCSKATFESLTILKIFQTKHSNAYTVLRI